MAILLDDLQEDIKRNGYKDEYRMVKINMDIKELLQLTYIKLQLKIIQCNQATKYLLPKNKDIEDDDGFEAFINSRG